MCTYFKTAYRHYRVQQALYSLEDSWETGCAGCRFENWVFLQTLIFHIREPARGRGSFPSAMNCSDPLLPSIMSCLICNVWCDTPGAKLNVLEQWNVQTGKSIIMRRLKASSVCTRDRDSVKRWIWSKADTDTRSCFLWNAFWYANVFAVTTQSIGPLSR